MGKLVYLGLLFKTPQFPGVKQAIQGVKKLGAAVNRGTEIVK